MDGAVVRPELVVEVTFDHTSNERIRHGTKLVRWRDDKDPRDCTMEQLDSSLHLFPNPDRVLLLWPVHEQVRARKAREGRP